jgi:hypothetical protein
VLGGPIIDVCVSSGMLLCLLENTVLIGSPPPQLGGVVVSAGLRAGGTYVAFSCRLRRMRLLPPNMLSQVASHLCPAAGNLHVADVCSALFPAPWDQQ